MPLDPLFTRHTTTSFTNAQIKALPTTPVQAVASPGAGKIVVPLSVTYLGNFQVPYTNVNNLAALNTVFAGDSVSRFGPGYFFGAGTNWVHGSVGYVKRGRLGDAALANLAFALAGFDATALNLTIDNQGDGVFTGGHANNTLTAVIRYVLVDLPAVLRLVTTQWVLDDDPSGSPPDGYLLTLTSGSTFTIDTTAERGLAVANNAGTPEAFYP